MCSNRLQVNALKTEIVWCAPARRRHYVPDRDVQHSVHPVQSARDLGAYVDWCDDDGTHQSRAVDVLWYTETAQID